MAIKRIDLCWICVSDLKEAQKFFVDTLGLEVNEYDEKYNWLEVKAQQGGALLGIAKGDKNCPVGTNAVVAFTVDNFDETMNSLMKKGITFNGEVIQAPGVPRMIFFTDKDGNNFQLVEDHDA